MSRKSFYALTAALAVIALAWLYFSKKPSKTGEVSPALGEYISAYTSGYISNRSAIKILLANALPDSGAIMKPDKELFTFEPSISGTTSWIDNRTIEFKPAKNLPSGQHYRALFRLAEIMQVPEDIEEFEFEFSVIKQSISVAVDGMRTIDNKQMIWQKVIGTVAMADYVASEDAEKTVAARQDGKNLKIFWEHLEDNRHRFSIDSIQRKDAPGEVVISWDGNPVSVNEEGKIPFTIPGLNEFSVMDARVIQTPEQYIQILFSDPLTGKQNLDGLISLVIPDNANPVPIKITIDNNELRAYPSSRQIGMLTLSVETGVQNILGFKLIKSFRRELSFEEIKPQIKFTGNGVILPSSNGLVLPFEAVNVRAVDIKAVRIFENNIAQFFQVNTLSGNYELHRVGRTVLKKTIALNAQNELDYQSWKTYYLDLTGLIKTDPGAVYKIAMNFKKEYTTFHCEGEEKKELNLTQINQGSGDDEDNRDDYSENYYYYDDYDYYDYNYEGYDYEDRYNPCKQAYYGRNKEISRNIIASDLGIIAKRGNNGEVLVAVSDIRNVKPTGGVSVELLNYQQQVIAARTTDNDGFTKFEPEGKPFLLVARKGDQRGYLKMDDGSSLSMSMFDVSGEAVQKGIKGFLYGERGVWRPGDSLYLTFILEDKDNKLPENHPVIFELFNPRGQQAKKIVKTENVNGFYNFSTATNSDAPTGNWNASVQVGGVYFSKTLKIETVMPNRLKIKLDFGADKIYSGKKVEGVLESRWLHGAIARNLKAQVDVTLSEISTQFKNLNDYVFDDPVKRFTTEQQTIFDGNLDNSGKANIEPDITPTDAAPGMLKANFTVRVFEEGGNFSIDRFSLDCSPYKSYVGVHSPDGEKYSGLLFTDTNHVIQVVTVDEDGKAVDRKDLTVKIYKLNWRWWWDRYDDNLANYLSEEYHSPYRELSTSTVNGKGRFVFRVDRPEWGRFLIHVTDNESGHSAGKIVFVDWPYWAGRSSKGDDKGAKMLQFSSDKDAYNVGDKIKLSIPTGEGSRALVSVEDGTRVLDAFWVDGQKGNTEVTLVAKPENSPNVYVFVSLIQPHAQTKNDLPVRMYGTLYIPVENPETHLYPEIKTTEFWRPEEKAVIKVSEKNNNPMTYTVAVVDDGLLDLTRFKTPDPWSYFFAREALGVKTWDLYDWIIGAYGAELKQLLAIGGDVAETEKGGKKANRFKPMVKFFGPYHLKKGKTATHEFTLPRYVGSVRVMVVAGNTPHSLSHREGEEGSYGSADITVPVKKPVMVLATLPRVVGPGETVDLPVTVFAMDKSVGNVKVEVEKNEFFEFQDGSSKTVSFSEPGDEVIYFRLKVKSILGIGKVSVTASSGSEKATEEIEIDVRNPNPLVTNITEAVVEPGKSWTTSVTPPGMAGTNKGALEVSTIPPINLGYRLKYLITYPHGCIEQTTSGAFPQLYLADILELNSDFRAKIDRNIKAGIDRLIRSFQTTSGGFAYWPGDHEACDWGSTYAGHFLLEADAKGYNVPAHVISNWKRYQKQLAQSWRPNQKYAYWDHGHYYNDALIQAYRLYTLALARSPELAAMNRLKEMGDMPVVSLAQLAAAYALAGQTETAQKLLSGKSLEVKNYVEMSYTYGSDERDRAIIIKALCLLNEYGKAAPIVKEISQELSNEHSWMGTQTTAWCLMAVSDFAVKGGASDNLGFSYSLNGSGEKKIETKRPIVQIEIPVKTTEAKNVSVTSASSGVLFVRVITEGYPETGDQTAVESNLGLDITYRKMDGTALDVTNLDQGTDFYAEVTISNPGTRGWYKEMALTQIFPSGWEIHNTRMDEGPSAIKSAAPTYQDIRDDRVYTYFNLGSRQKAVFTIILNAAYTGRFYLPTVACEAMYDNSVNARKPGKWIEISKAGAL